MKKDLNIGHLGMAAVMLAASSFFMLGTACGNGGGENRDADADARVEPAGDEGEAAADVPAEDSHPGDPVPDEEPGETIDAVEAVETADVPADEAQDTDAADPECIPPMIYHPGFDTCVSTEGLGADCTGMAMCRAGQDCVEYYGIGGNPFYECYIPCGPGPDRLCPAGFHCEDISDGPQNVCMAGD
jgi:hypothetical protein